MRGGGTGGVCRIDEAGRRNGNGQRRTADRGDGSEGASGMPFQAGSPAAGKHPVQFPDGTEGAEPLLRAGMPEQQFLELMFDRLELTARSCHRLLRVARTLADLDGEERIGKVHLSEAACLRLTAGKYSGAL